MDPKVGEFTCGYYNVRRGTYWHKFANEGELQVCDNCMWDDPRYIAVYGVVPRTP